MVRLLFHGSKDIIRKPVWGQGKRYNDYGLGFYCTENLDMALEWGACKTGTGYANCYEIDCDGLNILNLNSSSFTILHWLAVLLQNRQFDAPSGLASEAKAYLIKNFSVPYEKCDAIIGYRADDSYFSFAQDFINGTISFRQLSNAMYLGKLGLQFVLKSRLAFERIRFLRCEVADTSWYNKKIERDHAARRDYFNSERSRRKRGDLYITQIRDEEIEGNDARLRQTVS